METKVDIQSMFKLVIYPIFISLMNPKQQINTKYLKKTHNPKKPMNIKVDPVVNNADELFMANVTQLNKIKYLQTQKSKRENFIKDLEQSLKLNKQSISLLAEQKKQSAVKKLNEQNRLLHIKLKQHYEDCMNVNALLLIEQQLRIEQKKFYSERLLDFQTNMMQLRKYLQDKQQSFASVVCRLKKYEDLSQITVQTKLHKLESQLNEQCIMDHIKKLTEQRDRYKLLTEKINININDLSFLKSCLENKKSYQSMLLAYCTFKDKQKQLKNKQDKGISFYQKTKNTTNISNLSQKNQINQHQHTLTSNIKNPNKQLIKLLKKQKLNNEILQQALNQAIQKNQQLVTQNTVIVQANQQLQRKIQKLQSKGYLLQQQLTRYDRSLAWNHQYKSKCDIDKPTRINQFKQKGQQDQHCLASIQQDMQKLSLFIMTCVPKNHLVKSSSNPNFARNLEQPICEGQDIDIQEI